MSQSDYITYKRTQTVWKNGKLPAIIQPSLYDSLIDYSMENTVYNTKLSYSQLLPQNMQKVYGMEKSQDLYCTPFEICQNTNQRSNRKLNLGPIPTIQPGNYVKKQTVYCCSCESGQNCYCNKRICKSKTQQICSTCHSVV